MTGRSKPTRRTPQSSSGTIAFSSAPPETHYPQRNYEYAHRGSSSNTSLPNLGITSAAGISTQERVVKNLVDKLNAKLPCHSGLSLSELEDNESVLQIVEALLQLSRHCVNIIVWSLCEILDKLSKKYVGLETAADILESECFVVRVLTTLLTFHWNISTEERALLAEETWNSTPTLPPKTSVESLRSKSVSPLSDPPALEDNVAKYALVAMLTFIRRCGPTKADNIHANDRIESFDFAHDIDTFYLDASMLRPNRQLPGNELNLVSSRGASTTSKSFNTQGSNRSGSSVHSGGTSSVSMYIPSAMAVRQSTFTYNEAPSLITHLAGRVIYRLSATNWTDVFNRIRTKIHFLAANTQDEAQDIVDLRLVTYSLMDKNRLIQVMQELASLLVGMRPEAQSAVAVALRTVVWNWIEDFPEEFVEVVQSPRRGLDGQPERVFDLLYQLVGPANKRIFWPTLAVLLAISPERLRSAEAVLSGTLKYGKKHNNLLEQLHSALTTQSKIGETAILCYNDICRAAFRLPAKAGETIVLRSLAPDLADELKSRLMNPPSTARPFYDSIDPIDVRLYADALVAILRYHPMMALANVLPVCLEPERSAAVKLCVVKALSILVTEAPKFPWQSALDKSIYAFVAPKLRAIMTDLHEPKGTMALRPLSAKDKDTLPVQPKDDQKELMLNLQSLWRIDVGFFLSNMKDEDYISAVEYTLKVLHASVDEGTQSSSLRTFGAILARISNPMDEYAEQVQQYMYHAANMVMLVASKELLRVTDNLEHNKRCINVIVAVLSQIADRKMEGRQFWDFNERQLTALAAVEAALISALGMSRLDLCFLAARGLRLMTMVEQDPNGPPPQQYNSREQAMLRVPLLESIGDPKIMVMGRVEFQKRVRAIVCSGAFPCITHLMAWRVSYCRWTALMPLVVGTTPKSSTDISSGISDPISFSSYTTETRQWYWENLTLMLAASAACCISDDPALIALTEYGFPTRGPFVTEKPSETNAKFIDELMSLLINPYIPAQIMARDALGIELTPKLFPLFFEILDFRLQESLEQPGESQASHPYRPLFVEQVVSVLKLIMDRISEVDAIMIKVDIGQIFMMLARYIHQGSHKTSELRIKARFCALVDVSLEKREILRLRDEAHVRNHLLDIVADWILESSNEWSDDDTTRNEQARAQLESNLAALRTCVNLLENLRLLPYDGPSAADATHVVSRLFHRYFSIFTLALAPRQNEAHGVIEYDRASQNSLLGGKHEALKQELVVSGIANMLHANTDAGTKHVLSLGYDDNPRLRAIFAHVFCRVLSRGTKFDQLEGSGYKSRKSQLCEMVKDSEMLIRAIIDICPMSETDNLVPVLLNIHDTRRSLMGLMRTVIQKQVDGTNSDMELFRSNDMGSRILSQFARLHGYNYLRRILVPLITLMMDLPEDKGYELDPSKLRPNQSQEENAKTLVMVTKAFLDVVTESVTAIPPLIRDVSREIDHAVTAIWPQSRYAAVGAFMFLRFIVPAIVSPESVDIEMPQAEPRASTMRRGLLLIAKIIQNLANNILFGKEAHMMILNPFLESQIQTITGFHHGILTLPPSQDNPPNPEEWLGSSYDETDVIVLHRFFQNHADKIGKVLLSLSRMTNSHDAAAASGKRAWDDVCSLLVDMGQAAESPTLIDKPSNQHQIFRAFMVKNGHRNTDSVREIFQNTMTLKDQRPIFILALSKINVETVDLELLMCHIFKTIKEKTAFEQPFDVIVDCTSFTAASEVPISWSKLCLEHMPSDLRQNFEVAYILNPNLSAQKFLRKVYHVCSDVKFANRVIAISSIGELAAHVHPGSLARLSYITTLETETYTVFPCHQHMRNQLRIPIQMKIGISHIRLISAKAQSIYPNLSCKTVEIIPFHEIGDVSYTVSRSDGTEFAIRRTLNGGTITFSSTEREIIAETIRAAKVQFKSSRPLIPAERSRLSDVSAALLNVGLLNVCDDDESLRGVAYDLLFAVCAYVNYEANPLVPLRGPFIPANTAAFILPFSERLASFVPQLTLDLILEFSVGFEKASTAQKITCLQYLNPWIRNLSMFANPTNSMYDFTGGKLRDSIRSLVDLTVKFPDVYPTLQRSVWAEMAKHDSRLLNIALDELMRAAIDGGMGSRRCEQVADTLIAMSSINVRARVLSRLRLVLVKASLKSLRSLSQSPSWGEISALARLALVAGYSSRLAVQNQLFVPEIAHLTTMLCTTGSLTMKTTVYGIAMNLIQSLHIARADDDNSAAELKRLLDEASQQKVLGHFGLVRTHPTSEYTSVEYLQDQISVPALEGITQLLIRALTSGAQTIGILNVWRARWMSLVAVTAFQICPYVQYRAFVVLGLLASSGICEIDDDMLYQMLVSVKHALASSAENDAVLMSMLDCIAKVIPGLDEESRYLPQIFWLAVALLQSTYFPLYETAARLLEVTLQTLSQLGFFKEQPMSTVLLEARIPLSDITTQLDSMMGLSFDTGFSFSLASVIFRGARSITLRPVAQRLLRTVLRIAAESVHSRGEDESDLVAMPLGQEVLGYFLALLPFASTPALYRELLLEAKVDVRWCPSSALGEDEEEDDTLPIDIELFGFTAENTSTPLLVISFVFSILNSYQGSEQEKESLFRLLATLAPLYPELCASAVVHYLSSTRAEWLLNNLTDPSLRSSETASAVQVLFRIAMCSRVWSTMSSSTLGTLSQADEGSLGQRTPHYRALEELDMHSLSGTWQFLPKADASKVLQWIPQLVDGIIDP